MTRKNEKRGLGRGLSALMADIDGPTQVQDAPRNPPRDAQQVDITLVRANPDQPRRTFNEEDLEDLARSVGEKGIIQPLIVRPDPKDAGHFQIVAGERRWRAAQRAKVDKVPVLVRELDDLEVLEIAIIENVQRADLNPVDEAQGYHQLMDKFGHTQEKLSEALGKSRSYIANSLRLLNLPQPILEMLTVGDLTAGHARALITAPDAVSVAKQIVAKGLSVRQVEALVRKGPPRKTERAAPQKDSDTISLESDLSANLGMKVSIAHKAGAESGTLSISYNDFDQLDRLCQILSVTDQAGSI